MRKTHRRRRALRGLGGLAGGGAINLLTGLSWQAGVSTTLSVANGKARATATNAPTDNPRIFKGPIHTLSGKTYRYQGWIYPGTVPSNEFMRISTTTGILNDGPIQETGDTSGPKFLNNTWTAGSNIDLYVGLVAATTANGQYAEVDDGFSITVVG